VNVPLLSPTDFVGIDGVAHLCAGGEAPVFRSHLTALERFAADKSDGMAGRDRMFDCYGRAKQHLSSLVGRPAGDIALLSSASEGVNVVVNGLPWKPGDNAVVADLEYPSLVYPLGRLQRHSVDIRVVPTRDSLLAIEALRAAVDERTRLVAVSQVSYLTGQRLSLPALADVAWSVGARLLVDATHALGVVPVDANYCDFLVSSCYKWLLAAHGVGVFVWNRGRAPDLDTANLGWHSVAHRHGRANPLDVELRPDADRFELGNPSFPSVYLLLNALERLEQVPAQTVEEHAIALGGKVHLGLTALGYRVTTPSAPADRAGNVCFEHSDPQTTVDRLREGGVQVWGSEGRVRVSTHLYNCAADVDRLLAGLEAIRRDE
jgi:selenocysteine lyase/cysteine desulfurase